MPFLLPLVLAATSSAAPSSADAELPPTSDRLAAYALLGFATNPGAVALFTGLEHRTTYSTGSSVLFRDLYFQYGAEVLLSGLIRPAVHAEWTPIKILRLRLQYDFWIWPGLPLGRGHGLVFESKDSPFNPEELERRQGEEIPGVGHRLGLAPTLQLKVWRIIVLNTFEASAWFVHGPRSWWREPLHDNMLERGALDGSLKNFLLTLFEVWSGSGDKRILTGVVYEWMHTISADITRQRLGAAFIVSPFDELIGFNRPTLFLLVGMNVDDRNREQEGWMQLGVRLDLDLANEIR